MLDLALFCSKMQDLVKTQRSFGQELNGDENDYNWRWMKVCVTLDVQQFHSGVNGKKWTLH